MDRLLAVSAITDPAVLPREELGHLEFHLESGDYFLYLASLLGFIEETLVAGDSEDSVKLQAEAVRATRRDLRALHQRYAIAPRGTLPA